MTGGRPRPGSPRRGALPGFAPAKVNLALHVLGRRADGYHDLESLIAFANVGDRLSLEPATADRLDLAGPFAAALGGAASAGDNLAMRAAGEFRAAFGGRPHRIRLDKRLPVAAGIGGGSADAAAVLRLLAAEAGIAADDPGLFAVARQLGSDVPACLHGRPCLVTGAGDRIAPLRAWPEVPAVLVNAGSAVPTAPAFRLWSQAPEPPPPPLDRRVLEAAADAAAVARALAGSRNMLTSAAISLVREIGQVLERLEAAEGSLMTRMSGSGGTCFALFADMAAAEQAARRIAAEAPGWWVVHTRLSAG